MAKVTISRKVRKPALISEENNRELEKENIYLKLRKRGNHNFQDTIPELKSILSPENSKSNSKPLTFWEKKLKNLESQNKMTKEKKHELYEFTETDESEPSYTSKKKCKQKKKSSLKRKSQLKSQKKVSVMKTSIKAESNELLQEKKFIFKKKEEKNLGSENNKFIFSSGNSQLGITSTPAYCKSNIIEASSFMFLSPVTKIENPFFSCEKANNMYNNALATPQNVQCSPPKIKRILRTRKIAL